MSSPTITPGGYSGGSVWNNVQAEMSRGGGAPPSTSTGSGNMAAAAGIGAGATIGGAAMQGKAAKDAARIQAQSYDKALAFQRQQEEQRKLVYDQKMAEYTNMRNTLAQRYGINLASGSGTGGAGVGGAYQPVKAKEILAGPDAFTKYMSEWKAANPGATDADRLSAERAFRGQLTGQDLQNPNFVGTYTYDDIVKPVPGVPAPGTTVGGLIKV